MGRVGSSQPTQTLLDFRLAHAQARDAVHRPLDVTTLFAQLAIFDLPMRSISSNAPDRATYLQRRIWGVN
ncbi:ethanolamine ammonia-lyase light chain EutC [Acidihalobacter yilgarnensis]|uniref:ethanolamine ammonia-lyase light chain EutC n=1 Tax=Acidihalobacter yilgarnensis TaxID=2819280 RepID=UPI003899069C